MMARAAPQVVCASDSQPDSCDASSFDEDEYQEPAWVGRRHGQPVGQPGCWDAMMATAAAGTAAAAVTEAAAVISRPAKIQLWNESLLVFPFLG